MPYARYPYADGRRDSELEQAIVRILIGLLLVLYLLQNNRFSPESTLHLPPEFVLVMIGFLTIAIGVSVHVALRPGIVPVRRLLSVILDVGTLTYLFFKAESYAAPLYFFYLWIIIGYGFRFGKKYLFISLALSLAGFGGAILLVPYWRMQPGLSMGLWLGILLISVYLSTLVGRLYRALDHAEVANRAKRQFISSVSHELRTPLNAIIGMVDLLKGSDVDREQQDMLECMSTTSQVMLSQIEDVLDFSKIEAGKMAVEQTDFDLYRLVFGIVDIFRYRVDLAAVEFLTSIASDVPYALRGDPRHLRQILVNLLANAVKFTEQGRITIRIRKQESLDGGVRLRFAVKDTGVGIAHYAQGRIFESFTQADESTARRYGGTGLGTTICKQLVELLDGKIGFSSEPGLGSEFWFELDIQIQNPSPESGTAQMRPIRCMLIGAQNQHLPLVADLLDQCGAPVQLVDEFNAGLAKLEHAFSSGKPVRLILVEEALPPATTELIPAYASILRERVLALRAAANDAPLSLILVMPSGLSEESAEQIAELAGFSALLAVPVDRSALHNLLHAHRLMLDAGVALKTASLPLPDPTLLGSANLMQRTNPGCYNLLVAEDNPTNRKVIQKILERAGHRCTLAKDGEEALDLIEKKEFDAIVLDMNMPLMTGLDVARAYSVMRGSQGRGPIIMFSANVTVEARQESLNAGADEFLPKPIQIDLFLHTLDALITKYKATGVVRPNPAQIPIKNRLKLQRVEEPNLSLRTLEDLETVSRDPQFLDELIREFITENGQLIVRFEAALLMLDYEEIKEILHALKGAAVSIGAISLKMICKRIEKMNLSEMETYTQEVLQALKQTFNILCEELEEYRQQRRQLFFDGS